MHFVTSRKALIPHWCFYQVNDPSPVFVPPSESPCSSPVFIMFKTYGMINKSSVLAEGRSPVVLREASKRGLNMLFSATLRCIFLWETIILVKKFVLQLLVDSGKGLVEPVTWDICIFLLKTFSCLLPCSFLSFNLPSLFLSLSLTLCQRLLLSQLYIYLCASTSSAFPVA